MLTLATGSQGSGKTTLINSLIGENEKVVIETDILNKIDLLTLGCKKNDVLFVNHPEFKLNSNNLDILISKLLSISNRDVNIYLEIDVDKSDFLIDYIEKGLIKVFSCVSGEFGYGYYDISQFPTDKNPLPAPEYIPDPEHIKKEVIYVCEEEKKYEGSNIFYASLDYQDCVDRLMNKMLEMKKQREEIYPKVEQVYHNDYLWELIDGANFYYRIHVFK